MTEDPIVLVTGGTDGIGRAAARRLAERGTTVLVTGRDERKGERVLSALSRTDGDGEVLLADFADPNEVRALARRVRARYDRLDVLVNNAGTWQEHRRTTRWGGQPVEYTFAVNHLAPFLLTNLLVPALRDGEPARVVTVSSGLHRRGDLADLDAVVDPPGFDGRAAYAASKLANVLFAFELADRLEPGVTATVLHPGTIPETSLSRQTSGLSSAVWNLMRWLPFTDGVEDGARAIEQLAASSAVAGVSGAYFEGRERAEPASEARDDALRERLWTRSAELSGLPEDVPAADPLTGT